jgi:hypothetical protein
VVVRKTEDSIHPMKDRYFVLWQQIRPAGTTNFGEWRQNAEDARDFARWLRADAKADGSIYIEPRQRDAAGKWQPISSEELPESTP